MDLLSPETFPLNTRYCESLTEYKRRKTVTVRIGDVPLGSDTPSGCSP